MPPGAAAGTAPPGDLKDVTPEALQTAVGDKVAGHLWLTQTLVPLLRDDPKSSWTVVTGLLGELPWAVARRCLAWLGACLAGGLELALGACSL